MKIIDILACAAPLALALSACNRPSAAVPQTEAALNVIHIESGVVAPPRSDHCTPAAPSKKEAGVCP